MKKNRLSVCWMLPYLYLLSILLCGVSLGGAYIPDVAATATSNYEARPPVHMVDGSGLVFDFNGIDATHSIIENYTMWLGGPPAGDNNPEVYFNFNTSHKVGHMMFWNYNGPAAYYYGVQEAKIYYSLDSNPSTAVWTLLKTQTFTAGPAKDDVYFGQRVDFNITARLIRLDITKGLTNRPFPGDTMWVGISEVRFYDPCLPGCDARPAGDIDGDCEVDFKDFAAFSADWLETGEVQVQDFYDNFTGTTINPSKWMTSTVEGTLTQNNALVFASPVKTTDWDKNFAYTVPAFPATNSGKVLSFKANVKMSSLADFAVGFYPNGTFNSWVDIEYGLVGDRLDRSIWFMQGAPEFNRLLRLVETGQSYITADVRLEVGGRGGCLWQYNIGDGWKTARDTRNITGDKNVQLYRFVIDSYFYGSGNLLVDDVNISYTIPTRALAIDYPEFPAPVNAEFNGSMDERWTNWAGTPGVSNPPSTPDFTTVPGWIVMDGPVNGYGLFLRHYPFQPSHAAPFYAETHIRYPVVDPPECDYQINFSLLFTPGADLYAPDLAYPALVVQNYQSQSRTVVRAVTMGGVTLPNLPSGDISLPSYWNSGDLYLRIGFESNKTLTFAYKRNVGDAWTVFYTYNPSANGVTLGYPIGCDIIGTGCNANATSYEIDYVHFIEGSSPYHNMPFSDDFADGVFDLTKWEILKGTITEAGGHAIVNAQQNAPAWGLNTFTSYDTECWDRAEPNGSGRVLRFTYNMSANYPLYAIAGFATPGGNDIYEVEYGLIYHWPNTALYTWEGNWGASVYPSPFAHKGRITLDPVKGALWEYDIYDSGWVTLLDTRGINGDESKKYKIIFDNGGTGRAGGALLYIEDAIVEYVTAP